MQKLIVENTHYTLKNDRDIIAFAKKAKTRLRARVPKQVERSFPTFVTTMTTAEYIDRYQSMNIRAHGLSKWEFSHAENEVTAMYDPDIPLVEVFND